MVKTRTALVLCIMLAGSAAAQESLETAYLKARTALGELVEEARKSGHHSAGTLETIVRDLADIGAILEKENARRLAAMGPQILIEMKLFQASPELAKLGLDRKGLRAGEQGSLVITAAAAKRMAELDRAAMIAAPSILTLGGQEATVRIGGKKNVDWLQRQDDGTYVMKQKAVDDGIRVSLTATPANNGKAITIKSEVGVWMIVDRSPVVSGADAIGLPVVDLRTAASTVTVPDGGHVAVPFEATGDAPSWALIHARIVDPKKAPRDDRGR